MNLKPPPRYLRAGLTGLVVVAALCTHGLLRSSEAKPLRAVATRPFHFEDRERHLMTCAWQYFVNNRLDTGLVSSAAKFPATTLWDAGSQLAGMTAARELGLLDAAEFDAWMAQTLATLAKLPLYHDELPNKCYNAQTLIPVDYGQLQNRKEIGFSALDIGRFMIWLDIVAARYPAHAAACRAVTTHWKTNRLTRDGQLMGTEFRDGVETWNQEGRLGYEQYAAYGVEMLGLHAPKARDARALVRDVDVLGVPVPVDQRDMHDSVAHNYVTSEPYLLDGIETGFLSLPVGYASRVLEAQRRRWQTTGQLTVWSEDNLDTAPWFVYNNVIVDGRPWHTLDSQGRDAIPFRGSSVKAAVGWHALFRTPYTARVYEAMSYLVDARLGVFAGFYEQTQKVNAALTLNTNGIVLAALLYARVGRPLMEWAHDHSDR